MKKKINNILICTLLITSTLTFYGTETASAENPPEPPNHGWFVEGNGTYFEITNSSYLNISLTSSENVHVRIESIPMIVSFHIESNCSANSTLITLSGFETNKTYYMSRGDGQEYEISTDENGSYSYIQDISTHHHISVQEGASTIYINSDGTITPSSAPIVKDGEIYTLTEDIYEDIWIHRSGITLDGDGHTLYYGYWGIKIEDIIGSGLTDISIKNINVAYSSYGLFSYYTDGLIIKDCVFSDSCYYGFSLIRNTELRIGHCKSVNNYYGNVVAHCRNVSVYDCTFTNNKNNGIWPDGGNNVTIKCCKFFDNQDCGIYPNSVQNLNISNCRISNSYYGILLRFTSHANITQNIISGGQYNYSGIYTLYGRNNLIAYNTISDYQYGILLVWMSNSNTFHHNNFIDNSGNIRISSSTSNNWDNGAGKGNFWDDYTGEDTNGDGVGDTEIPHPYTDQGDGYYQLDSYPLMEQWIFPNDPCVAEAGGPYVGNEGTPLMFDAGDSYDINCLDLLEYRWDFDNDGEWDTSWSSDPIAMHTWGDDYSGTVVVEVTDGEYSDTDSAIVTVNNVVPEASILSGITVGDNYILATDNYGNSYFIDILKEDGFGSPELIDSKDFGCYGSGIGDFDNDGDLDALVGDEYNTWFYEKTGNDNNFASAVSIDSTQHYYYRMDFAEADYNNDGNLDAIMAEYINFSTYTAEFTIYLGNGDGTFTMSTMSAPLGIIGMDTGDFNDDSNIDFIASSYIQGAYIYFGNGDGTFQSPNIEAESWYSWGVCAGDFDNDGDDDFIFGSYNPKFYPNNGDGTFGTGINTGISSISALAESDINDDGNLDLLYTSYDSIYYYTGNGDGTFTFGIQIPIYYGLNGVAVSPELLDVELYEGDILPFTGTFSDLGWKDTHTATWDWGDTTTDDGTVSEENEEPFATGEVSGSHTYGDNGDYTITLTVSDDDEGSDSDTLDLTILNAPPNITSFTGPLDPVNINNPVEVDGEFTDPGFLDTHTATINWDDGNITDATVIETDGGGTVEDSHYYGQAGVYTVTLNVTDDDGDSDEITLNYYIVVYDPSAGFVTGGGWINSPEGAYTPNPNLTGKANFGFVSKYKKGQQNPIGNTEFQFHAVDMNFHSDNYQWLVITHHKAMYKGSGTINGSGNYGFMLSAIDEELTNSTEVDLFRIKIWDIDNDDEVIYDNMLGEDEDEDPTTEIGGGNIKIHKGQ